MTKTHKLTRDGKNWLINALDPFHDSEIPRAGYPDVDTSATIVDFIQQDLTVSSALGVAWDCHIFTMPDMAQANYFAQSSTSVSSDAVYTQTTLNTIALSLVNVATMATGTTTFTTGTSGGPQTGRSYGTVPLPATAFYPGSRLVGIGIEVQNTTAATSLQGMVTVYRQPQVNTPATSYVTWSTPSAATYGYFSAPSPSTNSRIIPNSVSEARSLKGSKQWLAKDGVYMIPTQFSADNPLLGYYTGNRKYVSPDPANLYNELGLNALGSPSYSINVGSTANCARISGLGGGQAFKPIPYNSSGAYFTGLSATTTLEISVRYFIEYAPPSSDATLVGLANPSPVYDINALKLYAIAQHSLPVGVPVGENPLGEWFARVLDSVAKYGGSIGTALTPVFGAQAGLLGKGAAMAASAARSLAKKNSNQIKQLKDKENKDAQQIKTLTKKVASFGIKRKIVSFKPKGKKK